MPSVIYAECHYAECRYAECRGALLGMVSSASGGSTVVEHLPRHPEVKGLSASTAKKAKLNIVICLGDIYFIIVSDCD